MWMNSNNGREMEIPFIKYSFIVPPKISIVVLRNKSGTAIIISDFAINVILLLPLQIAPDAISHNVLVVSVGGGEKVLIM